MLIKIVKTHLRALDPRTMKEFIIGEIVDLEGKTASDILENGYGIEHLEEKSLDLKIENKAIEESPENKAIEKSPKNKKININNKKSK